MLLLNTSSLKKMFFDLTLFENVSFNIESSDKIGFIGINGAGKSTLFKIISGLMDYDGGEIYKNKFLKIGYLDQHAVGGSDKTIMEEMLEAFSEVIEIERELNDIRFDIETGRGEVSALVDRQTSLQEKFSEMDGFYYKSKIKSTLAGLGFSEEDFYLKVSTLSGGQKTRVALGKILLSDANLLLLDEPTNHLDIESVEWLEGFLQSYGGAFVVISHDRYFLDKVTNRTFELENGRLRSFNGNYSVYMSQREIDKKTEQRNYDNTIREIHRIENVVEQQRRWNREKNIKTAESKLKVIERLEKELQKPEEASSEMDFSFKACAGGGQEVLVCEGLGKAFDENRVFRDADVFIKKGEKVFLLGSNGCGKTTLLKIITGIYPPTEGLCRVGANIHIGYYDQIPKPPKNDKTVIDMLWDEYPNKTQTQIRNALAVFLFRGEEVFKEVSKLSGGERARLELAKLMLKTENFLVLDEPTNHLDIESREALENALDGYDGTMLVVSHDRYFINKLAKRVLYMTENGIKSYMGNYDDYIEAKAKEKTTKQKSAAVSKDISYKEQKQRQAQKRKLLNEYKRVEEAIEMLEGEIAGIEQELLLPEYRSDFVKLEELSEKNSEKNEELEELLEKWELLQQEIEERGYEV